MSHTYLCQPSVFTVIKLSTTAVFSQGNSMSDQAGNTYTGSFLTFIQCPSDLHLHCRKPQEGHLISLPKRTAHFPHRHKEQLQLQA